MNWDYHKQRLLDGKTTSFRPKGNSMAPRILSGQLVVLEPAHETYIEVGDVVFCKVGGNFYVHLVKAIQDGRFLIANNRGHINGWTKAVYGKLKLLMP
jgi:phage repressor protein C with HTH and peptisase S24 domain